METKVHLKFVLPAYRIKLLSYLILSLFFFFIYALSQLEEKTTLSDFLLLTIALLIGLGFWKFIKRYDKSGFIIQDDCIFLLNGRLVCEISAIEAVDTSPYSFKSTNGFIIRLKQNGSIDWSPGLFWKFKRRISVGGLISKNESKLLSASIITIVSQQNQTETKLH